MGSFLKILTGAGVVAGISYFGRRKMTLTKVAAKGGGIVGYVKGFGEGFIMGLKSMFQLRFR